MTTDEAPFRRNEEESHLLLPDDLDLSSVEDVVAAFAPEFKPERWPWTDVTLSMIFLGLGATVGVMAFPISFAAAVAAFLTVSSPAWLVLYNNHIPVQAYQKQLNETPGVLFDEIAWKFKREIKAHRRKVLGPDSVWERARAPLVSAKDEANRSAAYWLQRLREDDTNEAARAQMHSAMDLDSLTSVRPNCRS